MGTENDITPRNPEKEFIDDFQRYAEEAAKKSSPERDVQEVKPPLIKRLNKNIIYLLFLVLISACLPLPIIVYGAQNITNYFMVLVSVSIVPTLFFVARLFNALNNIQKVLMEQAIMNKKTKNAEERLLKAVTDNLANSEKSMKALLTFLKDKYNN